MINKILLSVFSLIAAPFILQAQIVTLDYYFNHEVHKTASGQQERFHYLWEDKDISGFSIWGEAFKNAGAKLTSLDKAPDAAGLKKSNIYIIVDPDTKKESQNPNYINAKDIAQIEKWVKAGGVLVMMANDSANVELPHFNNDLQNHVIDDNHFQDGGMITTGNPIFKSANKVFMKDVCSISISGPAKPGLKNNNGAVIIAIAKYGKGTVFAVGDPWLYNEYTNGRLPAEYENNKAANDVAQWLIRQIPSK